MIKRIRDIRGMTPVKHQWKHREGTKSTFTNKCAVCGQIQNRDNTNKPCTIATRLNHFSRKEIEV